MGKMNQWYNRSYSVSFARMEGGVQRGKRKKIKKATGVGGWEGSENI